MDTIDMILTGHRKVRPSERVPIDIDPAVRERLRNLLVFHPELRGVGYSAFIERACEVAETAIAQQRTAGTRTGRMSCAEPNLSQVETGPATGAWVGEGR